MRTAYSKATHYDYYEDRWDDETYIPGEALAYFGIELAEVTLDATHE